MVYHEVAIMTEAWTFIDGKKVAVPLDWNDAVSYGWYKGAEFTRWSVPTYGDYQNAVVHDNLLTDWCGDTFAQNTFQVFHDSVWFYREQDAVLCQLRWS